MKKLKLLLIALLSVMTATLGIFGLTFAAEADESGTTFTMVEGASVKLTQEGMRFIVKMGSEIKAEIDDENTDLYFVISPKTYFDEVEDHDYYGMADGKKLLIKVDENKIYSEDGYYFANGCITQIREHNRTRIFNATAVVVKNGEQTRYTEITDKTSRDVYTVINAAALDSKEDWTEQIFAAYSWYGNDTYPVKANTQEEYNTIIDRINDGRAKGGLALKIGDDVQTEGEGVPTIKNEENAPVVTHNYYTVTFNNYDGTELQSGKVEYGTTPSYTGETPVKTATAQYTYTFSGWDKELSAVTGDVTYTATFSETINSYTVTFNNYDGTELQSGEVEYGTIPSYTGETPVKTATAQYTYTFIGWDKELSAVTGDVTYTATFSETVNSYTVTYYGYDKTMVLGSESVEYGNSATDANSFVPQYNEENANVLFEKWVDEDGNNAVYTDVVADRSIYAKAYDTNHTFTITLTDHTGTAVDTQQVTVGNYPENYGANLAKYTDTTGEYFYTGFPEFARATENRTYTANYSRLFSDVRVGNTLTYNEGIYDFTVTTATAWDNRIQFNNEIVGGSSKMFNIASYRALTFKIKLAAGTKLQNPLYNYTGNYQHNDNSAYEFTFIGENGKYYSAKELASGTWYTVIADTSRACPDKEHDLRLYLFDENESGTVYLKDFGFTDNTTKGVLTNIHADGRMTFSYGEKFGKNDVLGINRGTIGLWDNRCQLSSALYYEWNNAYNEATANGTTAYMVFDMFSDSGNGLYTHPAQTVSYATDGSYFGWFTVAVEVKGAGAFTYNESQIQNMLFTCGKDGSTNTFWISDLKFVTSKSALDAENQARLAVNSVLNNTLKQDPNLFVSKSDAWFAPSASANCTVATDYSDNTQTYTNKVENAYNGRMLSTSSLNFAIQKAVELSNAGTTQYWLVFDMRAEEGGKNFVTNVNGKDTYFSTFGNVHGYNFLMKYTGTGAAVNQGEYAKFTNGTWYTIYIKVTAGSSMWFGYSQNVAVKFANLRFETEDVFNAELVLKAPIAQMSSSAPVTNTDVQTYTNNAADSYSGRAQMTVNFAKIWNEYCAKSVGTQDTNNYGLSIQVNFGAGGKNIQTWIRGWNKEKTAVIFADTPTLATMLSNGMATLKDSSGNAVAYDNIVEGTWYTLTLNIASIGELGYANGDCGIQFGTGKGGTIQFKGAKFVVI